jgi:hypothetical protein
MNTSDLFAKLTTIDVAIFWFNFRSTLQPIFWWDCRLSLPPTFGGAVGQNRIIHVLWLNGRQSLPPSSGGIAGFTVVYLFGGLSTIMVISVNGIVGEHWSPTFSGTVSRPHCSLGLSAITVVIFWSL